MVSKQLTINIERYILPKIYWSICLKTVVSVYIKLWLVTGTLLIEVIKTNFGKAFILLQFYIKFTNFLEKC